MKMRFVALDRADLLQPLPVRPVSRSAHLDLHGGGHEDAVHTGSSAAAFIRALCEAVQLSVTDFWSAERTGMELISSRCAFDRFSRLGGSIRDVGVEADLMVRGRLSSDRRAAG